MIASNNSIDNNLLRLIQNISDDDYLSISRNSSCDALNLFCETHYSLEWQHARRCFSFVLFQRICYICMCGFFPSLFYVWIFSFSIICMHFFLLDYMCGSFPFMFYVSFSPMRHT